MEYIMADIAKIAEDLSNLTVLEAAELATMLEEKWGVSAAAAPMAMAHALGLPPATALLVRLVHDHRLARIDVVHHVLSPLYR